MGQCHCWGSSNDLWIMVRSVALDHEARGRIRHEMRYFHLTVSFREENWGIIVILYIMLKYEPVWSPRAQSAIANFSLPQSQDTFAEPIRVNITQNATDPRGKITTSINAVTSALKQTQIPRKIEKRYVLTKKVQENLDKAAQLKTKIENWHEETQRARFTRKDSRNSEIRANEKEYDQLLHNTSRLKDHSRKRWKELHENELHWKLRFEFSNTVCNGAGQ